MANANVSGWHAGSCRNHRCDLCGEICDERSADLNALDCTYSGCDSQVYHQECLEKYLRSIRCEKNRKTGFKCPRGCGKGTKFSQPCNGKITKSHPIHMQGEVAKKRKQQMQQPTVPAFPPVKIGHIAKDKGKEEPCTKSSNAPKILVKASSKTLVAPSTPREGDSDSSKYFGLQHQNSLASVASSSTAGAVSSPTARVMRKSKSTDEGSATDFSNMADDASSPSQQKGASLAELVSRAPSTAVPNAWSKAPATQVMPVEKPPPPPPREGRAAGQQAGSARQLPSSGATRIQPQAAAPALSRLQGAWARPGAPSGAPSSPEPVDSSVAGSEDVASSAAFVGSPESEDGWQYASGHRAFKPPPPHPEPSSEPTLSKAQRKNLKRAERKAQRKATKDDSIASDQASPHAEGNATRAAAAAAISAPAVFASRVPATRSVPVPTEAQAIPPPPPPRRNKSGSMPCSPLSIPSSPGSGSGLPGCPPPPPRAAPVLAPAVVATSSAAAMVPPQQWPLPSAVRVAALHGQTPMPAPSSPSVPVASVQQATWSTGKTAPCAGDSAVQGLLQGAPMSPRSTGHSTGVTSTFGNMAGNGVMPKGNVASSLVEEALQAIALRKALYCVNRLRQVGFPDWACVAAVARHGTNLEGALEYLVGLTCQLSTDTGANLPDIGSPVMDISEEQGMLQLLSQYTDSSEAVVAQAVIHCCGDLDAAAALLYRQPDQEVTSPSIFGETASHCFSPMHEPPTSPTSASFAASSPRGTSIFRQQSNHTGLGSSWSDEGAWQGPERGWHHPAAPAQQQQQQQQSMAHRHASSLWGGTYNLAACGPQGGPFGGPGSPLAPSMPHTPDVPEAALLAAAAVTSEAVDETELTSLMAAFQFT